MACQSLSAWPLLNLQEFHHACQALLLQSQSTGAWSVRLVTHNGTSLRITQCMDVVLPDEPTDLQELVEDDPEALIRIDRNPTLHIDYDIVLSPTYQVPILYFALRWINYDAPIGLDAVYRYVVPAHYQSELKNVGVMGGISMGYHPISGTPAFFIHPCNTAEAMAQIAGQNVTPGLYLLLWLGLVGHCVNLHVPREMITDSTGTSGDTLLRTDQRKDTETSQVQEAHTILSRPGPHRSA
ncbi:Atg10p [Penicillium taxi]|uniref:Atg10p n=1 Tax=Penicillium taxi TaxID=168475 RepID=UPI002545732C|nr:Atg10p [Penicillium taxi]KAJ5894400.1 Atg10p [Penicillium taxi]